MPEFYQVDRLAIDKRSAIAVPETYTEVGNTTLVGAELGDYEYGFDSTFIFDQANKSEFMRFSIDGGTAWTEFSTDIGNSIIATPFGYKFIKQAISGDLTMQVEMRKEDATGVMTVNFIDTYIRRVN